MDAETTKALETLSRKTISYRQTIKTLHVEKSGLEKDLPNLRDQREQLLSENNKLLGENKNLSKRLVLAEKTLNSRYAERMSQLDEKDRVVDERIQAVRELELSTNAKAERLESDRSALESHVAAERGRLEEYAQSLKEIESDIAQKEQELNEKQQSYKQEIVELDKKSEAAKHEMAELAAAKDEVEGMKIEAKTLQDEVRAEEARIAVRAKELDDREKTLNDYKSRIDDEWAAVELEKKEVNRRFLKLQDRENMRGLR